MTRKAVSPKKLWLKVLVILLNGLLPVAATAQNPSNANVLPAGQFVNIGVEHNVEQNSRKGMLIHANFKVQNALNKPVRLVAHFQYNDGTKLMGNEAAYQDTAGNVIAVKNFKPGYDRSAYDDLQVFLPYGALNMASGRSALRFRLSLFDVSSRNHFAYSGYVNFTYSR